MITRFVSAALRASTIGLALLGATNAQAANAGFTHVTIPDPGNPPIDAGVWYPANSPETATRIDIEPAAVARDAPVAGTHLKLVVFSHGQGGVFTGHADTAQALARAGFVAAALTHTGDNLHEQARVLKIWDRTRQLHVLTDWVLHQWPAHGHLDQKRIGVFGFSAGGFTALVAAGAEPDLGKIPAHCRAHPAEFTCGLIRQINHNTTDLPPAPPGAFVHDRRVAAAAIAAPALGFTFGKAGLSGVRVPVQLWRASEDETLPQPFYAQAVADDLPAAPEYHVVGNALHLDFLAPCDARKRAIAPQICQSRPGFDRTAFHRKFNAAVVRFFGQYLARGGGR